MANDGFKRPSNGTPDDEDRPTKGDLVGALLVVELREYDPAKATKGNRTTPMAVVNVTVVDGDLAGTVLDDYALFGNVAKQIAKGLDLRETGVGWITTGVNDAGNEWFGIEWAEDEADFDAAAAALKPKPRGRAAAAAKAPAAAARDPWGGQDEEPPF